MKILNTSQMRAADEFAIRTLGIPGVVLMENAGSALFTALVKQFEDLRHRRVVVLCGKGNNGGDGFVVARHLVNSRYPVRVILLGGSDTLKGDGKTNCNILRNMGVDVEQVTDEPALDRMARSLEPPDIVLDAILGTGLSSPVEGFLGKVIERINQSANEVVAVDLPSGLSADTGELVGPAIEAGLTVTFAALKRCHVFFPASTLCGHVMVANISIPESVLDARDNYLEWIEEEDVADSLAWRELNTHKGHYGHPIICAGAQGFTGAAVLAGSAALRSGAGLVTLAVPRSCLPIVAGARPEYMTLPLPETDRGSFSERALEKLEEALPGKTALAVGPGVTTDRQTSAFVRDLVRKTTLPIVIDADGLNAFAEIPDAIRGSEERPVVITPHPGEMSRLTGVTTADILKDRVSLPRKFSMDHGVVTVLKGVRTVIALPSGEVFVNPTGNPGMATGGTGDVLTGMIAAMLGRGIPAAQACIAAVFLHGRAGDIASASRGEEGMCAGDLVDSLPDALNSLYEEKEADAGLP